MVLPSPPPYTDPIPNNPFYSPQQYAVSAIPGAFVVGSGLSVSPLGVLSATGGGGGTAITADAFTGRGVLLSGTAPGAYTAFPSGPEGAILTATCCEASGLQWTVAYLGMARPNLAGKVLGQTCGGTGNISLDATCQALALSSGNDNVAFGSAALGASTSGACNIAIGSGSLSSNTVRNCNIALGHNALCALTDGAYNAVVGHGVATTNIDGCGNAALGSNALQLAKGSNNVAIGCGAGAANGTGSSNVAIGPNTKWADPDGCHQLSIGWTPTSNWLTGDCTKAIKPGAGIIDACDLTGTPGQFLSSTGTNAIQWATPFQPWNSIRVTRNFATAPLGHGIFQVENTNTTMFGAWVMVVAQKAGSNIATIKQWMNVFGPGQVVITGTGVQEVNYPAGNTSDWSVDYYPDGRAYWKFTASSAGDWNLEILYARFFGGDVTIVPFT